MYVNYPCLDSLLRKKLRYLLNHKFNLTEVSTNYDKGFMITTID